MALCYAGQEPLVTLCAVRLPQLSYVHDSPLHVWEVALSAIVWTRLIES